MHFFYWVALRSDPALPDLNGRENNPIEPSIGRQLDGLKKLHRCNFLSWVALRSDPTMPDLNIREQGHICGHMSTDIPIVPDRVGAGSLRVQDRSAVFSASGGKDSLIEPATSGQLANEDLYEEYKKAKSLAIELEKSNIWSQISDI